MAVPVKLSDELTEAAKEVAERRFRSVPKQIEYWAYLGRRLEFLRGRRRATEQRGGEPYGDLDAFLLEHDDWGEEVAAEQRTTGLPVWGYDETGELIST